MPQQAVGKMQHPSGCHHPNNASYFPFFEPVRHTWIRPFHWNFLFILKQVMQKQANPSSQSDKKCPVEINPQGRLIRKEVYAESNGFLFTRLLPWIKLSGGSCPGIKQIRIFRQLTKNPDLLILVDGKELESLTPCTSSRCSTS